MREQHKVVGHAVRAMYMYSAMADLAAELKDDSLKRACEVLWADVMASKIYITSGLGPAAANEGFTEDYDLPNDTAYAETCASVALIFWAQRMLHLDLDGKYADVMEQALFNGALTGLSRDGEHYFYSNPLDSDGRHSRWAWHTCPCCTMNSSRLVASVGGYFVSHSDDAIAFHLYGGISTSVALKSGKVGLREISTYPWSGDIRIEVEPEQPAEFTLKLRIPGWARGATASVNGAAGRRRGGDRERLSRRSRGNGRPGDVVALDLPMPAERIYAHPAVRMDVGRVALKRGPLVYCVEEVDNPRRAGAAPQACRAAPRSRPSRRDDLFDGIVTLTADAIAARRRRLGRHALSRRAAGRAAGDAHRPALLSLEQPPEGLDDGVAGRRHERSKPRSAGERTGATSAARRDASASASAMATSPRSAIVDLDGRQGRVLRAARPIRLRQVDDAAHDCRAGGGDGRLDLHQRRQRHQAAPGQAPHRHGVPVLCALSASDGAPEHRVLAVGRRRVARGADEARRRDRGAACSSTS